MKGTPAIYLGRIVDKKHFRAFVYGVNGEKKLIESWDAFESAMESGIWFATLEDAIASKDIVEEPQESEENEVDEKPKSTKPKPAAKPAKPKPVKAKPEPVQEVDDSEDVLPEDGSVFEVTDGFLPKESD